MRETMETRVIRNYILYLICKCGLDISLHPLPGDRVIIPSELISFNIHGNPYCTYLKSCSKAGQHCREKQRAVLERSKSGGFCGICHAGVKEYVYPIRDGVRTAGFICVSGYRAQEAESYFDRIAAKYGLSVCRLRRSYGALKADMPDRQQMDTLIEPLCMMLELAYRKAEETAVAEPDFEQQLLQYLRLHHREDITYQELCAHFSCSRSYISHRFRQAAGMSLREYLNQLRLEDARSLLMYSDLNITEISVAAGFQESSYFSRVFKEKFGMSPRRYRTEKSSG